MKKIYLFGTALLSILSTAGAWAQAVITITGENVEATNTNGYTLNLGESNFTLPLVQTIQIKGSGLTAPITIQPEGGYNYFTAISTGALQETQEGTENRSINQTATLTPDINGNINATVAFRSLTESEVLSLVAAYEIYSIEDLLNAFGLSYGDVVSELWGVTSGSISTHISTSFTLMEPQGETPSNVLSTNISEGISFDGIQIINPNHVGVSVYNVAGQLVAQSYKNINMSVYPAGVYVIKATNGASMKIVK